jgi:hypothetical protein
VVSFREPVELPELKRFECSENFASFESGERVSVALGLAPFRSSKKDKRKACAQENCQRTITERRFV